MVSQRGHSSPTADMSIDLLTPWACLYTTVRHSEAAGKRRSVEGTRSAVRGRSEGPQGISDRRARGRSWGRCGHLMGAGPSRVRSGGPLGLGPGLGVRRTTYVVPAGVLRGAAAAAPLAVKAAPLSGDCAAANAAGGRSEGDTVAPRRKLGLPQPGPRHRRPGCPLRLSLPRRPPPTPTCSGAATGVEGTTIPRGELSRTVRLGPGEKELPGHGSGNVRGSPRGEGRQRRRRRNGTRAARVGEATRVTTGRGAAARRVTCTPLHLRTEGPNKEECRQSPPDPDFRAGEVEVRCAAPSAASSMPFLRGFNAHCNVIFWWGWARWALL